MTLTNTNNQEVLFQDLCDEDIASISGASTTISASVTTSGDGTSSTATALVKTSSPIVATTPGKVALFNSSVPLFQGDIAPNQKISLNFAFNSDLTTSHSLP